MLRLVEVLLSGVLLGDGIWIITNTIDQDEDGALYFGLFIGAILAVVGTLWLVHVIIRRR
jgi:hypothetical protein